MNMLLVDVIHFLFAFVYPPVDTTGILNPINSVYVCMYVYRSDKSIYIYIGCFFPI